MDKAHRYSWQLLQDGLDPRKGPLSSSFGFLPDPSVITEARVLLPPAWKKLWKELPEHYAKKTIRAYCADNLAPLDVEALYEDTRDDPWPFLKTKSVIFNIAQAWVDCDRIIGNTDVMPDPPPFPVAIQQTLAAFATYCASPDYCTLADMSLTSAEVVTDSFDVFTAHFDELRLACPVNGAARAEEEAANDFESARVRRVVENRFHLMPTIMEYRTCDLPSLVSETQRLIHIYQAHEDVPEAQYVQPEILAKLTRVLLQIEESLVRLRCAMTLVKKSTVDPVVWHRDVVKFTAGYNGHSGMSGPQTPVVHLVDAFLGRASFTSELGAIFVQVRKQLQHNHQVFLRAVEEGPSMRAIARSLSESDPAHPVVERFNRIVHEYVKGFLAVHRGKAMVYAHAGFGQTETPRIFTAGTHYSWTNTKAVTDTLRTMFDEADEERASLRISTTGGASEQAPVCWHMAALRSVNSNADDGATRDKRAFS